jgi:hypothetical protein
MPKIDSTPIGPRALTPGAAFSPAASGVTPTPTHRAFPQSAASASLGPRPKPTDVAFARPQSFPVQRQALTGAPVPFGRDRLRDVSAHTWRDRAGPWFEPDEYQSMMQMTHGAEFRFRSDQYESDSEGSDLDDIPQPRTADLDPKAREERFQRDTVALVDGHEDILSRYRKASFTQREFLKDIEPGAKAHAWP